MVRWFSAAVCLAVAGFGLLGSLACQGASVKATPAAGERPPGQLPPPAGADGATTPPPSIMLPDAAPEVPPAPPMTEKCAEDVHQAERAQVDLLLLVDTSGSMTESAGMRSKWAMVRDALVAFIKDSRSAGLGVGLQFFPLLPPEKSCTMEAECPGRSPLFSQCYQWRVCARPGDDVAGARECDEGAPCLGGGTCLPVGQCSVSGRACVGTGTPCPGGRAGDMCNARGTTCRTTSSLSCDRNYVEPAVAIGPLPAQEARLVAAIAERVPRGGTPMGPAVEGAVMHLKAHLAANAGRKTALVLVSDGLPDGFCNRNFIDFVGRTVEGARTGMPALPTYVIGVFSPTEVARAMPGLTLLATSGGTNMPYVITTNDDLARRFQDALDQIRGSVLPCAFKVGKPTMGEIDFGKVNVRLEGGAGGEDIPYVGSADRCDPARGGWYYDRNPASGPPAEILLCEASCAKVKANGSSRVDIKFGCTTRVVN